MVTVGGHYVCATVANNSMGHGFYQFSPEVFYRILTPEHGFEISEMLMCELVDEAPWYRVKDPETIGHRVELINSRPTYIMFIASRTRDVPILRSLPQQSDYVIQWESRQRCDEAVRKNNNLEIIKSLVPQALKNKVRALWPFYAYYYERVRL